MITSDWNEKQTGFLGVGAHGMAHVVVLCSFNHFQILMRQIDDTLRCSSPCSHTCMKISRKAHDHI